jgi:hypothetical protein
MPPTRAETLVFAWVATLGSRVCAGIEQQATRPQPGGQTRRDDEQTTAVCLSRSKQRDTRPLYLSAPRDRVIDRQAEVFEEIDARNALKVADRPNLGFRGQKTSTFLVVNSVGTDFDQST